MHGGTVPLDTGWESRQKGENLAARLIVMAGAMLLFATTAWSSAATGPASPPTVVQLKAALLPLQDLPPGYGPTKTTSSNSNSVALSCLNNAGLLSPGKLGSSAEASFSRGPIGPFLLEEVEALTSGTGASTMAKLDRALGKCQTFQTKNADGTGATYTLTKMTFPHLGDDTTAFRIQIQISGKIPLSGAFDFAIVRRADNILILGQGGLVRSPDGALLASFAEKAYERLNTLLP
jgi:hypothetical protein